MKIIGKIQSNLIKAIKEKNTQSATTLRGLKSSLTNFSIAKKQKFEDLSDQDVISVLKKEAKKCEDSISIYSKSGRTDLLEKENFDFQIIKEYIPEEMAHEDVKFLVDEIIKEFNYNSHKEIGQVVQKAKEKSNNAACPRVISSLAKEYFDKLKENS